MAKEKKEKKERKEKKEKKKVSEESIEPVSGEKQKQNDDSFNVLTEMTAVALDNGNEPTEKKKKSKKTMTEEEKEEQRRINRESREKKKLKKELNKKRKRGELVEEEEEEKEAVKADDDQNDTTTEEERKIKKPKTEKKEKEPEYGVWVGNLAFSTTTDTIKDFFKDCGKVKRMRCPKGNGVKNNNKGFAYVFFSTSEEQAKAIAKSEQELEGRALLIKAEDNFERADGIKPPTEKEKKEIKKQKNPPCPTLFLGNLSFEATEQSIREAFEWAGDIRKVRVATFEDSGKCKGFAYVDYFTVESATKNKRTNHLSQLCDQGRQTEKKEQKE
ncbi:hypothetical protein RMATCC62417_07986 [Rhizopus microsporus]|nr:hypothetical protein RMATCC62417_07986 [Rhizopus microsporus]